MHIGIIIPITRRWGADIVFENLMKLDLGTHKITVLFYIDSNDVSLLNLVETYARVLYKKTKIADYQISDSGNQPTLERKVSYRRNRIVEMKQKTAKLVKPCDYIFSFEDDTQVPTDAMLKLLNLMQDDVGFVQGIQCGRWDLPMVGAWQVDDYENPTRIKTLKVGVGVEPISAGGFYCYMTPYDLYTSIPYHWHDECFGPDVCYGLDVQNAGLRCLVDYSIVCGHMVDKRLLYPNGHEKELEWALKNDQWIRQFSFFDLKRA